jgi:DNA polymerase-4
MITMVDQLGFELRKSGKVASTVVVKIRYANFDTHDKQLTIPYTSADHVLSRTALELFEKLYSRRMLIRLIGVKLSGLVQGNYQISLFDDTAEQVNLYQAMDKIRMRFGAAAVMRAVSICGR